MFANSCVVSCPLPAINTQSPARAIASAWRDRNVTIDGLNTEWQPLSSFGQESRYSIALLNDNENLYVVLATNDPATGAQMLTQGLIVWFDPEGGMAALAPAAGAMAGLLGWSPAETERQIEACRALRAASLAALETA